MAVVSESAMTDGPSYNEAKVRMQIIDPIIRRLGYADDPSLYFELEQTLRYPYFHIGRKNDNKDVPLGKVDYRAGLKGRRGSFVVEAKAGSADLGAEEIEQAHSYAAHALVGANFFVLCNGQRLQIFETLAGHQAPPIVEIPIGEINARFHEIEAILSPTRLEQLCHTAYDLGLPLASGLGSSLAFMGGYYTSPFIEMRFHMAGMASQIRF